MGVETECVDPLKKKANIEDVRVLQIHNKYRLHLKRDFRELFDIETDDRLIIVKEATSKCPHCNKALKLPGNRMFVVKKENFALIIQKADNAVVTGTNINLA